MSDQHTKNKALIAPLLEAGYDISDTGVRSAFNALASDALFRDRHPFGDLQAADTFYDTAPAPLFAAWPDLERRDYLETGRAL